MGNTLSLGHLNELLVSLGTLGNCHLKAGSQAGVDKEAKEEAETNPKGAGSESPFCGSAGTWPLKLLVTAIIGHMHHLLLPVSSTRPSAHWFVSSLYPYQLAWHLVNM